MGSINISSAAPELTNIGLLLKLKEHKDKFSKELLSRIKAQFGNGLEEAAGYADCSSDLVLDHALKSEFEYLNNANSAEKLIEKIKNCSIYSRAWRGNIKEHEISLDYNIGTDGAPCFVELFIETDGSFNINKVQLDFADGEDNQYLSYWLLMAKTDSQN